MKLLLIIAAVAVLAIAVLSLMRGGTRVTRIERDVERDGDDAER
jgi:hypothetical protein